MEGQGADIAGFTLIPILVTREARRQLKIHAAEHDTSVCALLNQAIVEILKGVAAEQQARTA